MKSMLYAGAALMIGASIYGFADYRQTSSRKEFNELYHPAKKEAPPPVVVKKMAHEVSKVAPPSRGKLVRTKPVIKAAPAPREKEPSIVKSLQDQPDLDSGEILAVPSSEPVVKKKKKKIRRDLFSRAPLRDEEELELEKTMKTKKAKKEQ